MKDALIANPALAGALAAVVGAAWLLLFASRHDPREPPLAPYSSIWTRIPFIGHVFGMSSRRYEYFGDLARASDQPIFTVQLPGKKMYVVTKTEMIQQAQRNFRVLSFERLAIDMTVKMAGVSKQAHDLTHHGVHTDGYYAAIHENMVRLLQPASVRDTSSVALTNIERLWDTLGPAGQEAKNRIGLRKWLD